MTSVQQTFTLYYDAVVDTNREKAFEVVENALDGGISPEDIVFHVVIPAIEKMIDDLIVNFDTTISQHFLASKIAEEVTEKMIPLFTKKPEGQGSIVIGTSFGDFHGLGKKIVSGCLKANMFTVYDLGLNVAPEKFVDEAVLRNARVIGISSMMVHTATGEKGAKAVRSILKERGLEGKIKVVVGGAPYRFDETLYTEVSADSWAENGVSAVRVIKKLMQEAPNG